MIEHQSNFLPTLLSLQPIPSTLTTFRDRSTIHIQGLRVENPQLQVESQRFFPSHRSPLPFDLHHNSVLFRLFKQSLTEDSPWYNNWIAYHFTRPLFTPYLLNLIIRTTPRTIEMIAHSHAPGVWYIYDCEHWGVLVHSISMHAHHYLNVVYQIKTESKNAPLYFSSPILQSDNFSTAESYSSDDYQDYLNVPDNLNFDQYIPQNILPMTNLTPKKFTLMEEYSLSNVITHSHLGDFTYTNKPGFYNWVQRNIFTHITLFAPTLRHFTLFRPIFNEMLSSNLHFPIRFSHDDRGSLNFRGKCLCLPTMCSCSLKARFKRHIKTKTKVKLQALFCDDSGLFVHLDINEFITNYIENICILYYHLFRYRDYTDLVMAIITYGKLQTHTSLFNSRFVKAIRKKADDIFGTGDPYFDSEFAPRVQSFEFFEKSVFDGRELLSQFNSLKSAPIFSKMYKLVMYAMSLSIFEKAGLSYSAAVIHKLKLKL